MQTAGHVLVMLILVVGAGWASQEAGMDMQRIGAFLGHLERAVSDGDLARARSLTEEYLESEDFHSHVGLVTVEQIVPHPELLDLAETVIMKSIRENTVENLARLHPQMGNARHQKVEFGRLYSLYAWILWKRDRPQEALSMMEQAMVYIEETGGSTAEDRLRLGILEYGNGRKKGWEHVGRGLLMDSLVERRDPGYGTAIAQIVRDMHGEQEDPDEFVPEYRHRHADKVPDTGFIALNGERVRLDRLGNKVLLVNFFSPLCGSCRQEIPSLKGMYDALRSEPDLAFLFILNQPNLKQDALSMFGEAGISDPTILTVENGSAYDLISTEPTVWVVERSGKIVAKYTGYRTGDEVVYRETLMDWLGRDR